MIVPTVYSWYRKDGEWVRVEGDVIPKGAMRITTFAEDGTTPPLPPDIPIDNFVLEILGGVRGVVYDPAGENPFPSVMPAFSYELYRNGVLVTSGLTQEWTISSGSLLSGFSSDPTFEPVIVDTFDPDSADNYISLAVVCEGHNIHNEVKIEMVLADAGPASLEIQYSPTTNEEDWHDWPMLEDDVYARQRIGDNAWSIPYVLVGLPGDPGPEGPEGPQGQTGSQGIQGPAGADGTPRYTWIKYATSATGTGINDSPTGMSHIGIAYNKTTATESTTPGDYEWSLILGPQGPQGAQGNQGIQGSAGTNGTNGASLYTWLKYADTPTTGISDSPTGKKYMGIAYNKSSATESTTYSDYDWSLIEGPQGATGGQGIQGPAGADGTPRYTWIKYGTSAAGAGLTDSPTGMSYIGFAYNKTTATESTTPGDYEWSLILGPQGPQGAQGNQGIQGSAGTNGTNGASLYTWLKYADTPTTGISDSPTGKKYMGIAYNKSSATESTTYSDYDWSLIEGPQGATGGQGIQGPAGADGTPRYTWIKYGTSAAGAGLTDSPTGMSYIGFAYNKTTATESTTPGDYEWSLILGPQGPQGNTGSQGIQGPAGPDGNPTYTWIKYATSNAGAGINDSPTGMTYMGIAYNKSTQTESTTPGDYEWSLIQGANGLNSASVALFRRTTTAIIPTLPSSPIQYTFSTGGVTGLTNSWTRSMTSGTGVYCWMIMVTAQSIAATYDIAAADWPSPKLMPTTVSRAFATQPTTPYSIGDLYILNNGVMLRCTTARGSGSYVGSDWSVYAFTADYVAANVALSAPVITGGSITNQQVTISDQGITVKTGGVAESHLTATELSFGRVIGSLYAPSIVVGADGTKLCGETLVEDDLTTTGNVDLNGTLSVPDVWTMGTKVGAEGANALISCRVLPNGIGWDFI